MEAVQVYMCSVCGAIHQTEKVAEICESAHLQAVEIHEAIWPKSGFKKCPPALRVRMSDGSLARYNFAWTIPG